MTVLILSCGTRCKLVRFFQETLRGRTEGGRVIAADASPWAPALYEADAYYLVPPISDPGYPERILEICRKEGVNALLPLLEDELELMAENRELFERQGITVLVSGAETVALCRDKYRFFRHLTAHGIPVLPTCISLEAFWEARAAGKMDFPVFVKPVNGCGSVGVSRVENDALLRALWESSPEPLLIQQFAQGEEIGADIYVDLISHRPVAVFTKKKVRMRAGEVGFLPGSGAVFSDLPDGGRPGPAGAGGHGSVPDRRGVLHFRGQSPFRRRLSACLALRREFPGPDPPQSDRNRESRGGGGL